MKKVLITGINGQDGSYLSEFLLEKGYEVHGILKRNSIAENQTARIQHLYPQIKNNLYHADMTDMASLLSVVNRVDPTEVYNLAAQSHVRVSFDQPIYTMDSIARGTMNLLEVLRLTDSEAKVYQASSSATRLIPMVSNEKPPPCRQSALMLAQNYLHLIL
jgi:GDPmannose 4,6-dehydratase